MRKYAIAATVKGDEGDVDEAGKVRIYGHELEVEGPDSIEEFIAKDGQAGVLDVLVSAFRAEQAATLRGRISAKVKKDVETGGGRMANAVKVDL